MKEFLKNTTASLLISVTLGTGQAFAGSVEAPAETISVIGMYVQKIAKVGFYIDTIAEGVTYVSSVGKKGFNAAVGALSAMGGNLSGFQNMLHFSDASAFNSLLNKAGDTITAATDKVDAVKENIDSVNKTIDTAKEQVENISVDGIVDEITDKTGVQEATDQVKQRLDAVVSGGSDGNSSSASAYARVGTMVGSYGKPHDNKQAATNYIKKMFFYSTKEGDKYEGAPMSETSQANEAVFKNRNNYRNEIIATSYATAVENRKSGFENSKKRFEAIQAQAASAATEDAKRAVGALITQEEARQRVIRLSLDLAVLERDVVEDLIAQPTDILIARTPEQIKAETQAVTSQVDLKGSNETAQQGANKNGGQS